MHHFVSTLTIYEETLNSIKKDLEQNKISAEEALEQAKANVINIKEILPAFDVIYPYSYVSKFENLLFKFQDLISYLSKIENKTI